jgi:hypothetical protein
LKWETLVNDHNHVCNPNFRELPLVNNHTKETRLFHALERHQLYPDKTDSLEMQFLLRQTYQTVMGIHDHIKTDNPLALVVVHPNEDTRLTNRRYRRMHQFEESKILTNFGVNWKDFEQMPLHEAETLLTASRERSRLNALNQQLSLEGAVNLPDSPGKK